MYTRPSYVHVLGKSYAINAHKLNEILVMNLIFSNIYSYSKYLHYFAHVAKYRYKYCKYNISYELTNVKALLEATKSVASHVSKNSGDTPGPRLRAILTCDVIAQAFIATPKYPTNFNHSQGIPLTCR